MKNYCRSVTLIELIIAIVLLSVVILGISNFQLLGDFQVVSAQRRSEVLNEVALIVEHMTKNLQRGVGNTVIHHVNDPGITTDAIDTTNYMSYPSVGVYVDNPAPNSPLGVRDASDVQVRYLFRSDLHELWFYPIFVNASSAHEVISRRVVTFTPSITRVAGVWPNYIDIVVTVRLNPNQAASRTNPEATMSTRIKMPSISTQ